MSSPDEKTKAYRDIELQAKIQNASPHKLIEMLFDGLLLRLQYAYRYAEEGNSVLRDEAIQKSLEILIGLHESISTQVESDLPYNLSRLYEYMQRQLLRARIGNDLPILDEVIALVEPLASGWREIGTNS
ncbi:Flagellar protein FliS [Thalassocella blandensis]|nr:Flagellar protein FliS [Thalassocella blandensis]